MYKNSFYEKNIESLFFEEKKKFLKKNNDELNYGGGFYEKYLLSQKNDV